MPICYNSHIGSLENTYMAIILRRGEFPAGAGRGLKILRTCARCGSIPLLPARLML